jgi:hypothetical protein
VAACVSDHCDLPAGSIHISHVQIHLGALSARAARAAPGQFTGTHKPAGGKRQQKDQTQGGCHPSGTLFHCFLLYHHSTVTLFNPSIPLQTGTDRVSYYKRQKRLSLPVKNKKLSLSVKKQKDCLFLAKNYYLRMIIPPVTRLVFRLKKII